METGANKAAAVEINEQRNELEAARQKLIDATVDHEAEAERAHAELAYAEEALVAIQAAAEAELMATREKLWGKLQQAVEKSKDLEKQNKEALCSVAAQEADIARLADEVERLKQSSGAEAERLASELATEAGATKVAAGEINDLRVELEATQNKLIDARAEMDATAETPDLRAILSAAQDELAETKAVLADVEAEARAAKAAAEEAARALEEEKSEKSEVEQAASAILAEVGLLHESARTQCS